MEEKDQIKVSVYCLSYNHEKYIRKTLDGFINQKTNFKYEVWVHDDASTDSSAQIVMEYEKKYPDIIHGIYQKDNKYSKRENICRKYIYPKLNGNYIACCEGDDYWCDELKLQKQFDVMERHPECSLSVHLVNCCNEDGSKNERVIPEDSYNIKQERILKPETVASFLWGNGGYPFHTSSYFFKKDVVKTIEYGQWSRLSRDIDILKAAILIGDIYYFDTAMSVRRLWAKGNWNSRMRDKGIKAWCELEKLDLCSDKKYDQFSNYRFHNKIYKTMLSRCFFVASEDVIFAKRFIKENKLMYSDIVSIKDWIKYFMILFMPGVWKIYHRKTFKT